MRCPFEWVVGDSSKGHTVTAPTFSAGPRPPAATPLYGALLDVITLMLFPGIPTFYGRYLEVI